MSRMTEYITRCEERNLDPERWHTSILSEMQEEAEGRRNHDRMKKAMKQIRTMQEQQELEEQYQDEQMLRDHMADDPEAQDPFYYDRDEVIHYDPYDYGETTLDGV